MSDFDFWKDDEKFVALRQIFKPYQTEVLKPTNDLGIYSGTRGWVGRRHISRLLRAGKVTAPYPTGGTKIDPLTCTKLPCTRNFGGIGSRSQVWRNKIH
ncbi:hypothetical protein AVEN_169598-1 [Araneus ventricosus]|uniref:Uncharacterized protein n=1 Tax=Araneus ventricosus TaxID=182803 RepID=A0A4Y2SAT3_ARAVE|nr:hypothetical protein AVEN_247113-1 [Araneus ventricosus]GBN84953.1 hypothetical protein AVEN_169598-1 [Araneus ventricosus]